MQRMIVLVQVAILEADLPLLGRIFGKHFLDIMQVQDLSNFCLSSGGSGFSSGGPESGIPDQMFLR